MNLHRITPLLCLSSVAWADGPVLERYATGGAGGIISIGSGAETYTMSASLGQGLGGFSELNDNQTVVHAGFWIEPEERGLVEASTLRVSTASRFRIRLNGTLAHVQFELSKASSLRVSLLSADGRRLIPSVYFQKPAGKAELTVDIQNRNQKAVFLVIDGHALYHVLSIPSITH